MRRREFIAGLGGVATWPLVARAQPQGVPMIGYLHSGSPGQVPEDLNGFLNGLDETGFVEGRNVAIEHRWAENQYDRFPALAADLVRRRAAVIVTDPPMIAAAAAKAATVTIPIIFNTGGDPVRAGLVASFNRPGGNVTGVVNISADLGPKRLSLLHEFLPTVTTIAVLNNPSIGQGQIPDMEDAARRLGKRLLILNAGTESDLDQAFATAVEQKAGAAIAVSSAFFNQRRVQLVVLAARHAIPTISVSREFSAAGGLMSYGTSSREVTRQVGLYAGRILRGEKPADLPVLRPTKFELVINLRTAKTLGLTIPETLLATADEVIQ
jgi:putative tryptophan/tyrosine transport system substrate-binding protein